MRERFAIWTCGTAFGSLFAGALSMVMLGHPWLALSVGGLALFALAVGIALIKYPEPEQPIGKEVDGRQ